MLQIGSIVDGKYKILNKVGQGGMSVVYLAMNERANKQWAIKEVRKDGVQDYEVVKQGLIVETDMLKKLQHDNLPSIIDVIDNDETFLIVMDYIEGNPLSKTLKEYGAQSQEDVIRWSKQLCDVLGYLHAQNPPIIYRDMKPSNVMLKPDGKVMLIDFGTAREFKSNRVEDTTCLGTRGYAAPEQYGGMGQTDARTDIYCLGATMYHLVTGHNPSEPPYQMYPIREWDPNLSSGLEEIIWKCTRDNPNERYQSCAELMYDLEHYSELDIEYKKKQNRRWAGFLTAAVLTVVSAVGAVGFRTMETTTRESTYDMFMSKAKETPDSEEKFQNYEKAINLNPEKEDAYLELLQYCFLEDDGVLSQDEDTKLRKVLNETSGNGLLNSETLKKNKKGYEQFAQEAAKAYYYSYEGGGNKINALSWVEAAAKAETLEPEIVERYKRLEKICKYYNNLGKTDKAGDAQTTYRDYWSDLVEITKGDIVELDNARTAIIIYNEMAGQIHDRSGDFLSDGVTIQEMEEQLDYIEGKLDTDFTAEDNKKGEIDKLRDNIQTARDMLKINRTSAGNSEEGGE